MSEPFISRALALLTTLLTVVATGALFAGNAQDAGAAVDPAPRMTWATDGDVRAIATTPSVTYIGGAFNRVGPATGPWVVLDATTGEAANLPRVSGGQAVVSAVAPDGSGGFYIGGDFTHVGGVARQNIAHVTYGGSVDVNFVPNADSEVEALAFDGQTIYAGGWFSSIGGATRGGIAALDPTGHARSWDAALTGSQRVKALAVSGSILYLGGWFTGIRGQSRSNIAAVDITTGDATGFDPSANAEVNALAVTGSTIYAGGRFNSIGGQDRYDVAALDATTGLATGWSPDANDVVNALAVWGSTVYVGGAFSSIGGQDRNDVAALDATTGLATGWSPDANDVVNALAVWGSTVYVGGAFTVIGGQSRTNLAALDATTGLATNWDPHPSSTKGDNSGAVTALAVTGSTVCIGGSFGMVGGAVRNNVAAIDNSTGEPTGWNPNADGAVEALAVTGSTVYAGGRFTAIGGQGRNHIAALDVGTGNATTWNPDADGSVFELTVSGPVVYAGGIYAQIGGQSRTSVAALAVSSGSATAWNANVSPGSSVYAIAVSGATVYLGGGFSKVGDVARKGIAAVDTSTGALQAWNPNAACTTLTFCNLVYAIVVSGVTLYVGGEFTSIGVQSRSHIAALDAATGAVTSWNPGAGPAEDGYVDALAVSGSTVYAGGRFTQLGGAARSRIGAVGLESGIATAWNPNAYGWNQRVLALVLGTDGTLYAGGTFSGFDAGPQAGYAAFPAPQRTLTVQRDGSGSGTVTSTDGRIDCGSACQTVYGDDALVELHATAAAGSTFTGWSGADCSGTGVCRPVMTADRAVKATFALVAPANVTLPAITGTPALGKALTCSTGTWTPTPTGYARQWKRNGAAISGATGTTYQVVAADLQRRLTCTVIAQIGAVAGTPATSAAVTVRAPTVLTARETTRTWAVRSCGASAGSPCRDSRGATVYFSGKSTPVPIPAATRQVTVRFYYRSGGVWRLKATGTVKAASSTGTWRLAKVGATTVRGLWRVNASAAGTTTLMSGVSSYRYYSVS